MEGVILVVFVMEGDLGEHLGLGPGAYQAPASKGVPCRIRSTSHTGGSHEIEGWSPEGLQLSHGRWHGSVLRMPPHGE